MTERTKRKICGREDGQKKALHEQIVFGGTLREIRKGKRFLLAVAKEPYQTGDTVRLVEMRNGEYTGKRMDVEITHLISDAGGLVPGYVIFQFDLLPDPEKQIEGQIEFADDGTLQEIGEAVKKTVVDALAAGLNYGA